MVDTPKDNNGDEATEDNPSRRKSKHGHHRRRSKPRHSNIDTGVETIRMLPKMNTTLIRLPLKRPNKNKGRSAQMNRQQTDTWRTTTTCLPPKTK